ncbi:MAG: hypothetical protein KDD34_01340 [Bdellovibrionales bacterium]|nr:hypothetical protein [Bdellovibrionales bacterium]
MIFEGSEKKVELVVDPKVGSLRKLGRPFWEKVVERAEAQVLSMISSEGCDAYLLSESSLFVWDEYFTMITCGQTTLVNAISQFLETISKDDVLSLIFERKNEYFPRHQHTDFYEDCRRLNNMFSGTAMRFGHADDHHLYLYHMNKAYLPSADDCTVEILMYDLQGQGKEIFSCFNQSSETIREKTKVDQIFPGFHVDDHAFRPCGYSLNAVRGKEYYTIHVTPEENGSYVSFESNINLEHGVQPTLMRVLEVFQPNAFDVIVFRPSGQKEKDYDFEVNGFQKKTTVIQKLSCGYDVSFTYHFRKPKEIQAATLLEDF